MSKEQKFYETQKFKELNKKWQAKLKATGFIDLENPANPDEPIPHQVKTRAPRYAKKDQTLDYYDAALHYLEYGVFTSMRQKAMWQMHAAGDSLQTIAEARMISKSAVNYHIQQVKKRMFAGEFK